MEMEKTEPKRLFLEGVKPDPKFLAAGRYGTDDMVQIWGPEKTFDTSLFVQGRASQVLSELHPDIVPPEHAAEIVSKASLRTVSPDRIRELEGKTGHDVIAISTALEEQLSPEARAHVGKLRTSADTTQTAKALQIKKSLEIIAASVENLRDIAIEKAVAWRDLPHMEVTHGYDALPSVAGRPFAFYAEMLASDLEVLRFFYNTSLMGKWSDATGNHHSAKSLGIDGLKLEDEYCRALGISHMIAPAQVPGLEFEADIFYVMARTSETLSNLAKFIAWGRGDDTNIFINGSPVKKKGSSAMPHKDAKNGNPSTEEQVVSFRNETQGLMMTALANCDMPYARTLYASANGRINFDTGFKILDHATRQLANVVYWIAPREERMLERVLRSYGAVMAQNLVNFLTDGRRIANPLPRSEAHDIAGRLATQAWNGKRQFSEVVRESEIAVLIPPEEFDNLTNPVEYIGESHRVIDSVRDKFYKKRTLE